MDFVTLGGNLLGTIPLGDIVLYINPFNLFLFAVLLGFTLMIALSKTETQVEATFHTLDNTEVKVGEKELGWASINSINQITKQTGELQLVL